MKWWFC